MGNKEKTNILVAQLQAGDETALSKLYDMYSSALYGLIFQIIKDEDLAQDILQEAFVNIWKKAKSYDNKKGSFFTWMLNISRNKSIDSLRKIERERNGKNQIESSSVYMTNGLDTNINTIGVADIVSKLPKDKQEIIHLLYFKGYTQQEVSDELEIPLGTVKTRARSAIKDLKLHFTQILLLWTLNNI